MALKDIWSNPGPDSGFSWVVLVACFCSNFILLGFVRCQGNIFLAILRTLNLSREEASYPVTTYMVMLHFAGLFTGVANHYFTSRQIILVSTLMASLGLCLSYALPQTVLWLCLNYGVVAGFSVGFVFPSELQILSAYFKRHRSKAQNALAAGFTCGGLLYPFLIEFVLEKYALKGSWLISCGILLQSFMFALLMRPRNSYQFPVLNGRNNMELAVNDPVTKDKGVKRLCIVGPGNVDDLMQEPAVVRTEDQDSQRSITTLQHLLYIDDNVSDEAYRERTSSDSDKVTAECVDRESLLNERSDVEIAPKGPEKSTGLKRSDRDYQDSKAYEERKELLLHSKSENFRNGNGIVGNDESMESGESFGSLLKTLVRTPTFYAVISSYVIDVAAFFAVLVVVVDYGRDTGMGDLEATMLVPTLSLGELVSRYFSGWLSDSMIMDPHRVMAIGSLASCTIYVILSASTGYYLFVTAFLIGVSFCMTSGARLYMSTNAFGIKNGATVCGVGNFGIGCAVLWIPKLIGLFRDEYGSYTYLFLLFSGLYIMLALIMSIDDILGLTKCKSSPEAFQ